MKLPPFIFLLYPFRRNDYTTSLDPAFVFSYPETLGFWESFHSFIHFNLKPGGQIQKTMVACSCHFYTHIIFRQNTHPSFWPIPGQNQGRVFCLKSVPWHYNLCASLTQYQAHSSGILAHKDSERYQLTSKSKLRQSDLTSTKETCYGMPILLWKAGPSHWRHI